MGHELTKNDIKKMEEEIEYRIHEVRKAALDDVKETRAQGDLSENFEYHADTCRELLRMRLLLMIHQQMMRLALIIRLRYYMRMMKVLRLLRLLPQSGLIR